MKKTLLVALGLGWPASQLAAQAPATPKESWEAIFFNAPAVALPLLTEAVLHHSAQLRVLSLDKLAVEQDIKITKKNILNSLAVGGTYSYGNLGGAGLPDPANPTLFNTYNASRYSTGVSLSMSLAQVMSRHNQVEREHINLDRTEASRQEREDQLRQLVIQLYQNVLLARKLLTLQQEAFVTVQSTYRLTEKQFRQGQLSLSELSGANAQLTTAAMAQETARSQYETAFMLLEETAGAKISTLMPAK